MNLFLIIFSLANLKVFVYTEKHLHRILLIKIHTSLSPSWRRSYVKKDYTRALAQHSFIY